MVELFYKHQKTGLICFCKEGNGMERKEKRRGPIIILLLCLLVLILLVIYFRDDLLNNLPFLQEDMTSTETTTQEAPPQETTVAEETTTVELPDPPAPLETTTTDGYLGEITTPGGAVTPGGSTPGGGCTAIASAHCRNSSGCTAYLHARRSYSRAKVYHLRWNTCRASSRPGTTHNCYAWRQSFHLHRGRI